MSAPKYTVCVTKAGKSKRGCGGGSRALSQAEVGAWIKSETAGLKKQLASAQKEIKVLAVEVKEEAKEVKALKAEVKKGRARDHRVKADGKKRSHHKKK